MYDIDVTGYENRTNKLHLFDIESVDESIMEPDGISFDKTDIKKNLTLCLYPDDSDEEGRLLRVYQQYFMVSCGAQLILAEAKERGSNLHDLPGSYDWYRHRFLLRWTPPLQNQFLLPSINGSVQESP